MTMPTDFQPDAASHESWFEPIISGKKGGTLLCFPFSGSGASLFARWKKHLMDDVNLLAARLPGRESKIRQRPCEDLCATADAISASLAAGDFRDDKLFLAGFSLGGLLAFEVARGLRRQGIDIELLVVGSVRAPQGRWKRHALHKLPDEKFVAKLQQQYAAIPQAVVDNAELLQLMLPMLRADIKMLKPISIVTINRCRANCSACSDRPIRWCNPSTCILGAKWRHRFATAHSTATTISSAPIHRPCWKRSTVGSDG